MLFFAETVSKLLPCVAVARRMTYDATGTPWSVGGPARTTANCAPLGSLYSSETNELTCEIFASVSPTGLHVDQSGGSAGPLRTRRTIVVAIAAANTSSSAA